MKVYFIKDECPSDIGLRGEPPAPEQSRNLSFKCEENAFLVPDYRRELFGNGGHSLRL